MMMNFLGNELESCSESMAAAVSDASGTIPSNGQQFHNDIHTKESFALMNQLQKNNIMCDVVLVAEGAEIPVHKLIMASVSPYFMAMFGGKMSECRADKVKLNGINGESLKELVEYVYTAQIEITEENVQNLLPAASLLELTYVRESCCLFLQSQLHPSNCLGIRQFADIHTCTDLLDQAKSFTEQHFSDVVHDIKEVKIEDKENGNHKENEGEVQRWLDNGTVPLQEAVELIKPKDCLTWYPVSKFVNNSRNNSPECMVKIDPNKVEAVKESVESKGMARWLAKSPTKVKQEQKTEHQTASQTEIKTDPAECKDVQKKLQTKEGSNVKNSDAVTAVNSPRKSPTKKGQKRRSNGSVNLMEGWLKKVKKE